QREHDGDARHSKLIILQRERDGRPEPESPVSFQVGRDPTETLWVAGLVPHLIQSAAGVVMGQDAAQLPSGASACVACRNVLVLRRICDVASQRTRAAEWTISDHYRSAFWPGDGLWSSIPIQRD